MGRKDDIQAQIDALTAELNNADADDEIIVEENGRRFHFKGDRATSILNKFSDLWQTDGGDGDGDGGDGGAGGDSGGDGGAGGDGGDPGPKGGGYFTRRKS